MRPAVKSVPHLASSGMNQVLKRHFITPASLNGDLNAVPKVRGGLDAARFNMKDFFDRYRGHALFGHAAISRRPEDDLHQALKFKSTGTSTHIHGALIEVDASSGLLQRAAPMCVGRVLIYLVAAANQCPVL
jgi:hypothetical protein